MKIWNQRIDLAVLAYEITQPFPKEEPYGSKSHITRAVVSIPSNIAEGCSRSSEKDFCRFLEISLGSAFEVEADSVVAEKLELINPDSLNNDVSRLVSE